MRPLAGAEAWNSASTLAAHSQSWAAVHARSASAKVTGDRHGDDDKEAREDEEEGDEDEDGKNEDRRLRSRTARHRSSSAGTGLAVCAAAQAAKQAPKLRSFGSTPTVTSPDGWRTCAQRWEAQQKRGNK